MAAIKNYSYLLAVNQNICICVADVCLIHEHKNINYSG